MKIIKKIISREVCILNDRKFGLYYMNTIIPEVKWNKSTCHIAYFVDKVDIEGKV